MYEERFQIAGATGFHARHIRMAGAAGLAFDFGIFLAAALGSDFGFASALGFAFASGLGAGVAGVAAAASCLNGQFSLEHDPVFLNVKHTWLLVLPEGSRRGRSLRGLLGMAEWTLVAISAPCIGEVKLTPNVLLAACFCQVWNRSTRSWLLSLAWLSSLRELSPCFEEAREQRR
eukprot:s4822_g3.t1